MSKTKGTERKFRCTCDLLFVDHEGKPIGPKDRGEAFIQCLRTEPQIGDELELSYWIKDKNGRTNDGHKLKIRVVKRINHYCMPHSFEKGCGWSEGYNFKLVCEPVAKGTAGIERFIECAKAERSKWEKLYSEKQKQNKK